MRSTGQIVSQGRSRSPHYGSTAASIRPRAASVRLSKRARIAPRNERLPFIPPEDWHEPGEREGDYRFVIQNPGEGYRHVVSPEEVRQRLSMLPKWFTESLEVVQFSRMTRKKQSFPCYGLQWGAAIYLYPLEEDLVEHYHEPPKPNQLMEARMYGGRWIQESRTLWKLVWTEEAVKDFYLNNILIHELGHLLDDRNNRSVDRERYAEWFATEYGYRATQDSREKQPVVVRHGKKR